MSIDGRWLGLGAALAAAGAASLRAKRGSGLKAVISGPRPMFPEPRQRVWLSVAASDKTNIKMAFLVMNYGPDLSFVDEMNARRAVLGFMKPRADRWMVRSVIELESQIFTWPHAKKSRVVFVPTTNASVPTEGRIVVFAGTSGHEIAAPDDLAGTDLSFLADRKYWWKAPGKEAILHSTGSWDLAGAALDQKSLDLLEEYVRRKGRNPPQTLARVELFGSTARRGRR